MKLGASILATTYIDDAGAMGRGVFARQYIFKGSTILECPTWKLNDEDVTLLDQTSIAGDYFGNPHGAGVLLVLGDISILNHSKEPNAVISFPTEDMAVCTALRDIEPGEQLFIDYGPDYPTEAFAEATK